MSINMFDRACSECGVLDGHVFQCSRRPAEAPRPDPALAAFAGTLPKRPTRANVHGLVTDIYDIVQREVSRFKGAKALGQQDIKSLSELARTLREVRQLEALAEDELAEELAKSDDAALAERARKLEQR